MFCKKWLRKNLFINFAEKLQKQAINIDQGIFNCYNSDWKYEYWEWGYSIMLIQFTVENHRSIKNSTVISFAASKDKSFEEYLLHPDEKKGLLPLKNKAFGPQEPMVILKRH